MVELPIARMFQAWVGNYICNEGKRGAPVWWSRCNARRCDTSTVGSGSVLCQSYLWPLPGGWPLPFPEPFPKPLTDPFSEPLFGAFLGAFLGALLGEFSFAFAFAGMWRGGRSESLPSPRCG